ncbi:uncharacterized protein METZ01_LOCUS470440 [marine metagenome]|uniref:Uncharacterized protein n=1 Tax=marine metagenome TaxID=408172 RepID=A0A383BBN1_9ZZZZ
MSRLGVMTQGQPFDHLSLPLRADVIQLGDGVEREPPSRVAQRDGAHAVFRVALQF